MITKVGCVGRQLETGQQRVRIPDVDVVNPSSSNVSGASDKLLKSKVTEGCVEEAVGMLVQTDVHVSRDSRQSLHVNQLLQVVHQIFLSSIGRPVGGYLMFGTLVRYF